MANEFNQTEANDDSRSQIELELLEALLASDYPTYPWNPADPEAESVGLQLTACIGNEICLAKVPALLDYEIAYDNGGAPYVKY